MSLFIIRTPVADTVHELVSLVVQVVVLQPLVIYRAVLTTSLGPRPLCPSFGEREE